MMRNTATRWTGDDGQEQTRTTTIDLRYFSPQELEAPLHCNGFVVERCYGDWQFGPFTGDSPQMICVCRRR